MKKLFAAIMAAAMLAALPAAAFTPDEAKALAVKGATLIEKDGLDKARPVLHDGAGGYKLGQNGELYVFVIDFNGTWLVYPPTPAGEGKTVLELKDPDGKYLVKEMISTARDKGEGWVEYRWVNPASNKIEPKLTYVKRVAGKDYFAGAGVYK